MKLENIGMLCVANNRSRYYLTELAKNNYYPSHVLLLQNPQNKVLPGQKQDDLNDSFVRLLKEFAFSYEILPTANVNDVRVISSLRGRKEKYYIYSGPGGAILKKEILSLGKEFLHIHPGRVPDFKGSTTIYYQILAEGKCAASAIFLREDIDSGPVIKIKEFPGPEQGIDLDYEFDPLLRATLLVDVIKDYVAHKGFQTVPQRPGEGETYFIIHPVLRHIAKLSLEKQKK